MDITKLRKNFFFVGRGSTAIYLILKSLFQNKEVILPCNICYAAIYPVIYSENKPVFVDIMEETGNASYSSIIEKVNENTGAIIFPYMYGNVSADIFKLKNYCKKHKIILIEDCASSMGATINEHPVGTIRDYAVFSTGHAKIVDVGNGGLILTDNNLDKIKNLYDKLPIYTNKIDKELNVFSQKYRELRNQNDDKKIFDFFHQNYQNLFLYQIDYQTVNQMKNKIDDLSNILQIRNKKYKLFLDNLNKNDSYKILSYEKGSTPWRFTIILNQKEKRKELINILLMNHLFVSDWYPCTGKYFENCDYPISDDMAEKILNFSLTDDENNIFQICKIINNYFKE